MNKLKNVGLGILSWYGYETLRASLESHKRGGLLELFDEKIIFFQEIDDEARAIAKQYGFEAHGNEKNTGIYGGFKALAESMQSKYILLLENDWQLIKPFDETKRQLFIGLNLLQSGRAIKACFRYRFDGDVLEPSIIFYKFFPHENSGFATQVRAFFYRCRHFNKVRNIIGSSRFYMDNPQDVFNLVEYDEEIDFLFYPSKYHKWANNPLMIERDFFIGEILARVEKTYIPKKFFVNGFRNIETDINIGHRFVRPPLNYIFHRKILSRSWWSKQNFKIATANSGIFAHARIGYRGY